MEKLNPNVIALSLGITTVIVYLVCLIFIAILPLQTIITVTNSLVHGIDVTNIATKNITLFGAMIGIVLSFVSATAIGYIFAFVYNWLAEKFS